MVKTVLAMYERAVKALNLLQSPMLLAVRLYWGVQFAQTGWGKLHNLAGFTHVFQNLNIPFPGINAPFVAGLELVGGILLILGLFSRPIAFLLACDMMVAYIVADRDALLAFFKDPDTFLAASPYTFLFASLMILIFGAGYFAVDTLIARRFKESESSR
jgi:putative oxidoreductase